jgi:long-chain acyl-CoA synthetase
VMKEKAVFDAGALRDFCRGQLTSYKVPKRIVELDDLPRSQIGKVLRRSVREQLLSR